MISIEQRINAFISLGKILEEVGLNVKATTKNELSNKLNIAVKQASNHNGWFIEENVRNMLLSIGMSLSPQNITSWIDPYKAKLEINIVPKTVGVVMAGNIPLVGFHDFLCVLISGNSILAKLSSEDDKLLPIIADILISIEHKFTSHISFTTSQLKDFDAIIATGSNNTSRYFEYYFGKYPNIIRQNRNGIAVLTGNETEEDIKGVCDDIFMYYGLGCRNISHIFVPNDYNFKRFLDICTLNTQVNANHKYFNNYEYNKAIFLVNGNVHFDSGNLLLTESTRYSSPVSVINYEYYTDINNVSNSLIENNSKIQCIVSISKEIQNAIVPGASQYPQLWDYADGIDTMEFLSNL